MRHRYAVLAALAAMLLLVCVTTASANRISITKTGFRIVLTAFDVEMGLGTSARCPFTIEGSFHTRTIVKTAGLLIGYINRAAVGACTEGTMTVLSATLPWHVQYLTFVGTLPNITRIILRVVGMSLGTTVERITCLAQTTSANPAQIAIALTPESPRSLVMKIPANGFTFDATRRIPASGVICESIASEATFEGTGTIYEPGTMNVSGMLIILI